MQFQNNYQKHVAFVFICVSVWHQAKYYKTTKDVVECFVSVFVFVCSMQKKELFYTRLMMTKFIVTQNMRFQNLSQVIRIQQSTKMPVFEHLVYVQSRYSTPRWAAITWLYWCTYFRFSKRSVWNLINTNQNNQKENATKSRCKCTKY